DGASGEVLKKRAAIAAIQTQIAIGIAVPLLRINLISGIRDKSAVITVAVWIATAIFTPASVTSDCGRGFYTYSALNQAGTSAETSQAVPDGNLCGGSAVSSGDSGWHIEYSFGGDVIRTAG